MRHHEYLSEGHPGAYPVRLYKAERSGPDTSSSSSSLNWTWSCVFLAFRANTNLLSCRTSALGGCMRWSGTEGRGEGGCGAGTASCGAMHTNAPNELCCFCSNLTHLESFGCALTHPIPCGLLLITEGLAIAPTAATRMTQAYAQNKTARQHRTRSTITLHDNIYLSRHRRHFP